jgi:hypothetical protein
MFDATGPASGFLPFWLAVLLLALSLLLMLRGLRGRREGEAAVVWPTGLGLRRILVTLGSLAIYTYLIGVVGYVISTFAIVCLLVGMLGSYRWYTTGLIGLSAAVGMYAVFQVWLGVVLPRGGLIIP